VNAPRSLLRIALVLALFVAGEFAASAHFAFVQHRVCAEHGELEHGAASHAEFAFDARGATELAREMSVHRAHTRGPVLAVGDAERAEHEHCAFGDKLAPRTLPVPFCATRALGAASPAPELPRADSVAHAFPLHLLAPKHSPPAAS